MIVFFFLFFLATAVGAQELPPELTRPVNDFAGVIDAESARQMEALIRSLQQASGDVVVVATVETTQPSDIREYAVKMFENHGRGIGQQGKDNGILVLVAVKDRTARIEVGYDLEQFITDGFAGETTRQIMIPYFRRGEYGAGLLAGVSRIIGRVAEGRNITLDGVQPERSRRREPATGAGGSAFLGLFIAFIVINAIVGRLRRRRRGFWGGGWGGWNSGVGPFGGGFGGGFRGGGGFGGGFGGFGGGRSGGGGGGGSW